MERPRAHSVMQMRPPSQSTFFNVRASKLFQKVSAKFGRSPDPAHGHAPATRDDSANNSPYMRRSTYSMDGAAKPYMSQPMLGLMLSHIEDTTEDSDGSARSSPAWSEGGNNNNVNLNTRRSEGNIAINPTATTRPPPRPSRAPPPPPPPDPQLHSNQNTLPAAPTSPSLTIPLHPTLNLTPATPISPSSPPPNALTFTTADALLPSTGFAAALLPATPAETDAEADGAAEDADADADADRGRAPRPLRRARSQTLSEGRNWSRPSSVVFAESQQTQQNSRPATPTSSPPTTSTAPTPALASSPSTSTSPSSSVASGSTIAPGAESTFSTTSSYATAPSSAFSTLSTTSTIKGLPVLAREPAGTGTSGLPAPGERGFALDGQAPGYLGGERGWGYASSSSSSSAFHNTASPRREGGGSSGSGTGTGTASGGGSEIPGLPRGAARAADPHAYSPVSSSPTSTSPASVKMGTPISPRSPSTTASLSPTSPGAGARLSPSAASSSSLAPSPTSSLSPDPRRASIVSFASGTSVDSWATALAGDESDVDAEGEGERRVAPAEGDDGEQEGQRRDRADTIRAPVDAPAASATASTSASPASTTPKPHSPPASVRAPPARAATLPAPLPPIDTSPLPAPVPVPVHVASGLPAPASSATSASDIPPWGPHGLAFHPRARTASAGYGYSYTPSSPRLGHSPSVARFGAGAASEFGLGRATTLSGMGTLPARRPPSMIFNPGAPHSPGGTLVMEELAQGRLSPSIIIPVLRLPSLPALPPLSPAPASASAGAPAAGGASADPASPGAGGVARRSSVIFGPGAHGREASRSVVRSMPALAMEGQAEPGVAAGESDEEDMEDGDEGENEAEERDDEDGEEDEGSREGPGATPESPFVPLRLDTAPLSLDFAGMFGGKGKGKERAVEATTGAQPLRQQASQSSSIAGKTPTAHPQAWQHAAHNADYFSMRTPTTEGTTPMQMPPPTLSQIPLITAQPMSPGVRTVPMPPLPAPERPGMYKHASRSMIDILQTSTSVDDDARDLAVAAVGPESGVNGKGKAKAKEPSETYRGDAPAYESLVQRASTLKRRRSMPEIMAAPPPYTMPLFPSPFFNLNANNGGAGNAHPLAQARIAPRDDEGRETLPPYSNDILLRGVMPRKMEFSAPGVQARDRKWRRVLCELEGTVFRVYGCAGDGWWERRVGVGDAAAGSAAASAAAAIKAKETAAAAREGQEVNKIAGEEGRIPGIGGQENGAEDPEADGTTEVMIAPRSSMSSARSRASSAATTPPSPSSSESHSHAASMGSAPGASRSRLNLGLSLLKPRSHGRSKSDMISPPKTPTSRSSLSIPRPSFSGSSSPGASSSGNSPNTMGAALAPSRSNVSLASSRSGVLSARAPATLSSSRTPMTPSKGKNKFVGAGAAGTDIPEPNPADLIRAYTLQHAESGLGNDYLKRKHVIRVRLEGEQFLLQARDVGDVVDWIEGLHSATNIALDLDERVMPKGPLFPRRRRRRQRPGADGSEAATTNNDTPTAPTTS